MCDPQSFISLDLVTFVLLSGWCFAVCLLLLTRRALFPVLWYLHLRAHPQLPWSAFWWSLLPVDCSTPTESKKKQLRREWQLSNCILDQCAYLVVGIELLVFSLTLSQGLPLGLQRLGQMGVFQALLGILFWQYFNLTLERTQLLPETKQQHIEILYVTVWCTVQWLRSIMITGTELKNCQLGLGKTTIYPPNYSNITRVLLTLLLWLIIWAGNYFFN